MSRRFFKLTAIATPLHVLVTLVCNFLALRTIFEDQRYLTYPQRLCDFLSDLFVQPLTAALDRVGIDSGSLPWGFVFLVLNSLIWGAAIAAIISMTRQLTVRFRRAESARV